MSNENVRQRLLVCCKVHGTPYRHIARETGLYNSLYVISRFARGLITLNNKTLAEVDKYLTERGY